VEKLYFLFDRWEDTCYRFETLGEMLYKYGRERFRYQSYHGEYTKSAYQYGYEFLTKFIAMNGNDMIAEFNGLAYDGSLEFSNYPRRFTVYDSDWRIVDLRECALDLASLPAPSLPYYNSAQYRKQLKRQTTKQCNGWMIYHPTGHRQRKAAVDLIDREAFEEHSQTIPSRLSKAVPPLYGWCKRTSGSWKDTTKKSRQWLRHKKHNSHKAGAMQSQELDFEALNAEMCRVQEPESLDFLPLSA
jgi:hypothetical protein